MRRVASNNSCPGKRLRWRGPILLFFAVVPLACQSAAERQARLALQDVEEARTATRAAGAGASAASEVPARAVFTEATTLDEYRELAERGNPGLVAALAEWRAALERVPQARALPDPQLGYTLDVRDAERQMFELSQMFPTFGKRGLRAEVALAAAEAARQRYAEARFALRRRTSAACAEYYYLGRAVAVTGENLALLKRLEPVVRQKYAAAAASQADLLKLQIELARMENDLRELTEMRPVLSQRLLAALGLAVPDAAPVGAPVVELLPWPRALPEARLDLAEPAVLELARAANPGLQAGAAGVAGARDRVRLARRENWPDVGVRLEYETMDGEDPLRVGLMLSLPLWRGRYRAMAREARAGLAAAEARLAEARNDLEAELRMGLFRLRDATRRLALYRDALLPQAEQTLQVSEEAYIGGKLDFLELIDAERMRLEFRLELERARSDYVKGLSELEALAGSELPRRAAEPPARDEETRATTGPAVAGQAPVPAPTIPAPTATPPPAASELTGVEEPKGERR